MRIKKSVPAGPPIVKEDRSRRKPSDDYETALHRFRHEWAHRLLTSKLNNKDAAATMGISQDTFRKYRDWNEPGAGERPRGKRR